MLPLRGTFTHYRMSFTKLPINHVHVHVYSRSCHYRTFIFPNGLTWNRGYLTGGQFTPEIQEDEKCNCGVSQLFLTLIFTFSSYCGI